MVINHIHYFHMFLRVYKQPIFFIYKLNTIEKKIKYPIIYNKCPIKLKNHFNIKKKNLVKILQHKIQPPAKQNGGGWVIRNSFAFFHTFFLLYSYSLYGKNEYKIT